MGANPEKIKRWAVPDERSSETGRQSEKVATYGQKQLAGGYVTKKEMQKKHRRQLEDGLPGLAAEFPELYGYWVKSGLYQRASRGERERSDDHLLTGARGEIQLRLARWPEIGQVANEPTEVDVFEANRSSLLLRYWLSVNAQLFLQK